MGDLCDTALCTYDAEQTNRVSSFLWGAGFPTNAPSVAHCRQCPSLGTAPVWGRLHGSLLAAYVKTSHCVTLRPGFGTGECTGWRIGSGIRCLQESGGRGNTCVPPRGVIVVLASRIMALVCHYKRVAEEVSRGTFLEAQERSV